MNVFLQELRAHRLSLIVWCVSMVAFMYMCMVKFDTLVKTSAETEKLMSQFPNTMMAVFGMSGLDVTTLGGYFGICFLFIMILVAVHAGLLGVNILAREAQTKTTEFLYTKPAPRRSIITAKLWAGIVQLVCVWVVTYIGSWLSIISFTSIKGFTDDLAIFMAAAALIQVVFFALGMLFAALARSAYSPAKWMSGLVFATYICYVLAQFKHYGWLRHISVFSYFNAQDILKTTALQPRYMAICIVVSIGATIAAYAVYRRRDLLI